MKGRKRQVNYISMYKGVICRARSRFAESHSKHKSPKGEKLERHHVLPKCMGGKNIESNYAYLTHKEHVLAHTYLTLACFQFKEYDALRALVPAGDNAFGKYDVSFWNGVKICFGSKRNKIEYGAMTVRQAFRALALDMRYGPEARKPTPGNLMRFMCRAVGGKKFHGFRITMKPSRRILKDFAGIIAK